MSEEGSKTSQHTAVELRLIQDGWKMQAQVPSILGHVFEMDNHWKQWQHGPDALKVVSDVPYAPLLLVHAGCYDGRICWDEGHMFSRELPARLSENRDEVISHNPEQGVFRLWSKEEPSSSQE